MRDPEDGWLGNALWFLIGIGTAIIFFVQ